VAAAAAVAAAVVAAAAAAVAAVAVAAVVAAPVPVPSVAAVAAAESSWHTPRSSRRAPSSRRYTTTNYAISSAHSPCDFLDTGVIGVELSVR
jgi:hypothetical protein